MTGKELFEYVDKSLLSLKQANLMYTPHPNMPKEMIDTTINQSDDWIPWKATLSIVSEGDILELENKIGLKYPTIYCDFLKYKHFYELENVADINFFSHCIRDWKSNLLRQYFESWEPDKIIEKGFIPFADYSDWGIVCFDTNRMNNNDCPIIMFDHETLYDEPVPYEELYPSFAVMAKILLDGLNNQEN